MKLERNREKQKGQLMNCVNNWERLGINIGENGRR